MKENFRKKYSLTISLVFFVFFVLIITFFLTTACAALFQYMGIMSFSFRKKVTFIGTNLHFIIPLLWLFLLCILLGTTITAFLSKKALNPIRTVIDATHQVAKGDFNVTVDIRGIHELEDLSASFNKMTHELRSIETLRNDFVNNFSHEFKTPIVSIRGFAKLLKNSTLTQEEQQEYLDIIISESERLSSLAANVLSLSKYENMDIITDQTSYYLDEQIRQCILLLEPKWTAKNISINLELENFKIHANEDILKQVWLNLLDNAIKFSHQEGSVEVQLYVKCDEVIFSIQDNGIGMSDEILSHIFDKFYQGDHSHSVPGNGLGLPLVKRILDLCNGTISVTSSPGNGSTFYIRLPQKK